jgi:hypothetical protein
MRFTGSGLSNPFCLADREQIWISMRHVWILNRCAMSPWASKCTATSSRTQCEHEVMLISPPICTTVVRPYRQSSGAVAGEGELRCVTGGDGRDEWWCARTVRLPASRRRWWWGDSACSWCATARSLRTSDVGLNPAYWSLNFERHHNSLFLQLTVAVLAVVDTS